MKLLFNLLLIAVFTSNLNAQCSCPFDRPETIPRDYGLNGKAIELSINSGIDQTIDCCSFTTKKSLGAYPDDSTGEDKMSWRVTFRIKRKKRKSVRYKVKVLRAKTSDVATGILNGTIGTLNFSEVYESSLITKSSTNPNELFTEFVNMPVDPEYTYYVKITYKTKRRSWQWFWRNLESNSWNIYENPQSNESDPVITCSFGNSDGANCFIMEKPNNGFIYENCFYVLASTTNICPAGTTLESGKCLINGTVPGVGLETGFFEQNNKLYKILNSGESCNAEIIQISLSNSVILDACLFYDPQWPHIIYHSAYDGWKWTVNTAPSCPSGYNYDGANCLYRCAPEGREAFEYAGNWYYTRD